ncbi:MAG TPA: POTRA domain-containing protein [Terriglobales bacterium]|nr:POTRA domain-containing protein [Terriglobales bacterium]
MVPFLLAALLSAQTGPTATPQQAPRTAPQVEQVLPSYEGQNVSSVELAGQPDIDPKEYEDLLVQKAGEPFSQQKVEQTQHGLEQTARFQAVELEIRPDVDGVRILYVLQPALYFGVYEFPGADGRFSYSRLLQVADYPPRGAFTPVDVANAQNGLVTFFRREGFFLAQVTPEFDVDRQHGLVNVRFRAALGRKANFGNVTITGDTPEETRELQDKLKSVMARLKGAAIRRGKKYSFQTLQNATQYLNGDLMHDGHLGASVTLIGATYDPQTNRADIAFNVKPGPIVKVDVEGAHLWPWTKKREIPLLQQAGVNPEVIQEARHNLVSYFQSKGYFDIQVSSDVKVDGPDQETVVYQIKKGPRHRVKDVGITGNQHLSEEELMGHVKVGKAHFFSHGNFSDRLVQESVKNLKKVYAADGFSSASVTPQVEDHGGNIVVRFRVDEGPQDVVSSLRIEGNTVPENQLSDKPLQLQTGQAYSLKRVDDDRSEIVANYLRKGYLNASFRGTATHQKGDKHKVDVVYHITEGPRVQIAQVVTLGRRHTEQWLIEREAQLYPEHVLREDDVLGAEARLYSLNNVFDWVEVDPRRQITTQTEEDILVKLHEGKRNELTYGFGFEVINRGGSVPSGTVAVPGLPPVGLGKNFRTSEHTFWGPRVNFQYIRKNIFGRGETLTFGALGARLDQRGSITFTNPHFRGSDWSSNITIDGEHNSENPIFTSRLGEAGYQFQRVLDQAGTQNLFFRYNFRQTGLSGLLIPELVPPDDRHVRLSTASSTYTRDTRDNILDAHKGIYESFEFDLTPEVLGSSVSFAKLQAQASYYRKTWANITWANSVRVGLEQPFAGSHVPVSEKFFTGGGSTLRGFPLNGAGPQHVITACGDPADKSTCAPITVPVGGQQLLILNSELRIPTPAIKKGLGFAVFYDGGNVFDRIGFHNFGGQYTNNVGFGVRYDTPVGPVRIDLGHNLDGVPGVKSTQLFITIGQAF